MKQFYGVDRPTVCYAIVYAYMPALIISRELSVTLMSLLLIPVLASLRTCLRCMLRQVSEEGSTRSRRRSIPATSNQMQVPLQYFFSFFFPSYVNLLITRKKTNDHFFFVLAKPTTQKQDPAASTAQNDM